jgi:hypothetical protein
MVFKKGGTSVRQKFLMFSGILLTAAIFNQAAVQTKCVWIVKSKDDAQDEEFPVSDIYALQKSKPRS